MGVLAFVHLASFLSSLALVWLASGTWTAGSSTPTAPAAISRGWSEQADPEVLALSNELESWMTQSGDSMENMPYHLQQVLSALNTTHSWDGTDRIFGGTLEFNCDSCTLVAKAVIGYVGLQGPIDILANFIIKVCYAAVYQSMTVCRGIINQEKDQLNWILRHSDVTAEEACGMLLGHQNCGRQRRLSWNNQLPSIDPDAHYKRQQHQQHVHSPHDHSASAAPVRGHPQVHTAAVSPHGAHDPASHQAPYASTDPSNTSPSSRPTETSISSSTGKKVLKVLHLTDTHFDPHYVAGSNAVCEAPLCCNRDSGVPKSARDKAGRWGDYRSCDSPRWLLQHMFQHIISQHPDIDYVLCTGDLVPHHIWKINRRNNIEIIKDMTSMVKGYFPDKPVYGAVGNHESFPRDSFPPPEDPVAWSKFGVQWLYDAMAERWGQMMGQPAPDSARFGGYYSVLARPGLRIISLNTNYCYKFNWWILYKSHDPGWMLVWLTEELREAEKKGELVHIIGHIPPFYQDCFAEWAHQFARIVSRFAHVIKGQFYGHSHKDEFRLHYDYNKPKEAINVEYITPNNGPYHDYNPSFRLFYVDGDHPHTTRNVLDYETWVMNLTHANTYNAPHWYKLYSARHDLQLPSLEPHHWDNLVERMARDPRLYNQYYRYQVQDSDPALAKGCDAKCRFETLCSIVSADRFIPSKCRRLDD